MQFNYNNRLIKKSSFKKSILKFLVYFLILLLGLFLLSKFNFPAPEQEIKENITNETIKLK